jgi:methylated-DNA-protein-cysteine methyltransferase related protein
MAAERSTFAHAVRRAVRSVPAGRVTTYGRVAEAAGRPGAARAAGAVLRALPEGTNVPWWRVVDRRGEITIPRSGHADALQRALLEAEGVRLSDAGRIELERYGWSQHEGSDD